MHEIYTKTSGNCGKLLIFLIFLVFSRLSLVNRQGLSNTFFADPCPIHTNPSNLKCPEQGVLAILQAADANFLPIRKCCKEKRSRCRNLPSCKPQVDS